MSFILITGASSGIGREFARQYAAQRRSLLLVARSAEKLALLAEELCRTFQVDVKVLPQDLSQLDAPARIFDYCQTQRLEIELLINNAGVGLGHHFLQQRLEEIESMMSLNMGSLVKLTHLFLPTMVQRRSGGVINVASVAAFQGTPNMCVYAATKAFVLSFSEALAEELSGTGVRVMALCPGGTATQFFERAGYRQTGFKLPIQSSEAVVRTAIRAFERGKTTVVTGWLNNLLVFAERFTPRWLNTKLAGVLVGEM